MSALSHNSHERDQNLLFDEGPHKYTVLTDLASTYTSVTTWVHHHFTPFDALTVAKRITASKKVRPDGLHLLSAEEIVDFWSKKGEFAAKLGTALHLAIEQFYTIDAAEEVDPSLLVGNEVEWAAFQRFHEEHVIKGGLKPYRSEWMIYLEDSPTVKLAGSIDMVFRRERDGAFFIYDWKRIKELKKVNAFNVFAKTPALSHLPDTNYWHYALQLNTYKTILEAKYGLTVAGLSLVCFIGDKYSVVPLPDLTADIKELLFLIE